MAIRFLIAAVLGPHSEPFALSNSWHLGAHRAKVTKALRRTLKSAGAPMTQYGLWEVVTSNNSTGHPCSAIGRIRI